MLNRSDNILLFVLLFWIIPFLSFAQVTELEIWQIQGDGLTSPYQGQEVTTTGNIITAIGNGFFFLQSPAAQSDQDLATSNGIYVASDQVGNRKIGDVVKVKGTVLELDGRTQIGQGTVQISLLRSGESLPEPLVLNANFPSGIAQTPDDLEAVEGMRIQFTGITCGPSDYRSMVPVVARAQRPFREAGIRYPGLPVLPVWDGNPEIFWLLPNALGGANNRFISANTPISAIGPVFQAGEEYILLPEQYQLQTGPQPTPARAAGSGELTIASLNTRRLEEADENFDQKVKKLAKYVVEMLRGPDLLALQEVGSTSALSSLRFFIQQLDPELNYTPFLLTGNDDIHLAYLVKESLFQEISVTQLGKQAKLPGGGTVFDRPPLLFTATLTKAPATAIHVLNVHLRSLLGIEGDSENFVREKRYAQSLAVAEMVQELQGENLLVVGDFNAYPFSDGYVDVVNQISGQPSIGAQYPPETIVNVPLKILGKELPAEEQYSFVFEGSAQLIDHALVSDLSDLEINEIQFARANADFPDTYAPNEQLVQRASDHDGFVIYLQPDLTAAVATRPSGPAVIAFPNPIQAGQKLHFQFSDHLGGELRLISTEGKLCWRSSWSPDQQIMEIPEALSAGLYQLQFWNRQTVYRKKIVVLPPN